MAFEDLLDQVTEAPNPAREGQLAFRQAGGTSGIPPVRARLRQLPIEELDVPDRIRSTLLKRREQELETTRVREEGGFAQFRQQLQEGITQDRLSRGVQNLASFANKNKDNPDAREALDIMRSIQGLHDETLHQRGPVEAGNVVAEAILEFTPSIPLMAKAILVDGLVTLGLTAAGSLAGVGGAATGFAVGASRVARGIGRAAKVAQGGKLAKGAKLSERILKNAPRKAISGGVTTAVFFPEFFSKITNRVLDAGGSLETAVAHGYWGGFVSAAIESLLSPARMLGLRGTGGLITRPLSDKIGEWLVDKPIRKVAARLTMNRVIAFIGEDMEEGAQGGVSDMAAFLAAKAEKDPEVFNSLMEEINEELKRHEGEEGFEEVKNAWDMFTRVALKDAQQAMKAVAGGAILGIPGGIRTEGRNAFKVRNRRQDLRDRGVDPDLLPSGRDEGLFLAQADAAIEGIDERQVRARTLRQERKNKAAARQAEQAKTDDQREILGDGGSRASEIIAAFHLGRDIEGDAIVETIRADTERQAQAVDDVTQKQAIREAGRERIESVRKARDAVKVSRKNQVQEDYAEVRNTMVEIAKENIKATTPDISDEALQSEAERQVDTREQEILLEEGIAEQKAGLTSEDAEEQVDNLPEEQQEETNILRSIANLFTDKFTQADLDADIAKRSRRDVQTDLALSELPESAQQFLKELPSGRGFKKRGEAPEELTRNHFHKIIEMLQKTAGITWNFETRQWVPFQPDTGEVVTLADEIRVISKIIAKTGTTKERKEELTRRRADLEQRLEAARDREAQTPTPVPEAPETPEGEQGEPQLIPEERRLPAARAPEQERRELAARLLGVLGQIPAIGDEVFPGIRLLSKSAEGYTFDITDSPISKDISRIALNERTADFIPAREGDADTLLIRKESLKDAMVEMQMIINDVHEESRESPVGRPLTIDDLRGITMMSDDPVVFDVTDASFEVRRAITDSGITIFERDGRNLAGFTDDVSAGEAINTLLAIQTSVERPPDPVVSGERGRRRQKNREAAEKADRLERQRLRKSHSQHDSDVINNIKTLFGRAAVKKRWEDSGTDLKQDQWILANQAIFHEEREGILKPFQERMKEAKIWDFQILNIRRQIAGKAPEDTVGVRIEGRDQSRTVAEWQTVIEGKQAQINEVFADKKTRDLFLAVGGDKKKGTITDDEIARRLNDIDSQSTYEAEFGDNVELHKVDRAARLVDALLEAERPPVTLAEMGEVISLINEGFESVEELNLTQRQQALLQEGQTATAKIFIKGLVTRSDRPPGTFDPDVGYQPGPATVEGDQIRIRVEVYDPVQELVSDLMYQLENTLSRLHRIAREDIQGFETVFVDGQPRVESRNQAGREAKFRRLFNLFLEYYQLTASQLSFKDAVTGVTAAQERQKARQNESAADMGIDKELTNYGFNNVRLSPENKVIVNRLDAEINAHDKEIGILRSAREDRANTADQLDRIDNLIRIQVVERDDKLRQMTTILNQGERTKEQIRTNIHELIGFEDEEYRRTGGKSGVKIEPDSDIAEELGRRFVKDVTEVAESRAVFAMIKRLKADPKFLSVGQIESKIHDAVKFEGVRGNDIRRAYASAMMAEFNRVENLNKDARREASEKGEILPEHDYERTNLESMVAAISDVDLDARIAKLEEEQKAIERRPSSAGGQVVAQLQTEIDRLNGERIAPEGFKPKTRQLNAIARAGLQLTSTPTSLVQQSIRTVKKTLKSKEDRQGNTLDKQIWRLLGGNTDPFLVHSTKLVNEMATNEGIKLDSQDDTQKKLEGSARRQIREAEEREAAVPFGEEGTPITRFEGTGEELDLGREDFSDKFVKALTEEELDEIRGRLENEYVPAEVNYVKSLMAMERLAVFLETGQQPDPARDKRRLDDATARARREFRKDLGQIDTRIDQRRLGERERRFTQEEINTVNEFFQLQRAELREGTQQNLDALVEKVSGKRFKEEGGRVIARATSAAENAETLLGSVGTTAVEDIAIHTAVRRASRRFGISEHEVRSIASGTMLTGTDRLPARSRAATEAEGEAREEQSDAHRLLAERTLDSRSGLVERATLLASNLINRVGELVGRAGTQPGQAGTRAVPAQDTRLADARLEESRRLEEFRRNFPEVDPEATGLFPLTFEQRVVRGGESGVRGAISPGFVPHAASVGGLEITSPTGSGQIPVATPRTGVPTAEELAAERTVRGAIRQAIDEFRDVMADLISDETIIQNLRKMYGIHTEGRPGLEVPIPAQRAEFDDTGVQTAAELPPAFRLRRSGPQRIDDRIAGTILDELQRNLAGVARNIQIGQTERTAEETAFLPRLTAEVNDLISRYKTLTETGSVIGETNVARLQRLRGELAVAEESGTPQDVARLKWDIELEERGVVGRFQLDPQGRPIGLDEVNRNLSKAFGRRVNLKEGETTTFRDGLYNIKIETGRGRPSQVKIGDGFAHIFIDLDSATATTVRHETLGHLGLAGMNNANLNAVIDYLGITNESIAEEAASNRSLFPDLTEEQANRLAREEMVNQRLDEIDSGLAQATPRMQAIIAQFKEFLARIARAFGIDYRPTGPLADIARIRSGQAQRELLEGRAQPGFEAASGTRRQPVAGRETTRDMTGTNASFPSQLTSEQIKDTGWIFPNGKMVNLKRAKSDVVDPGVFIRDHDEVGQGTVHLLDNGAIRLSAGIYGSRSEQYSPNIIEVWEGPLASKQKTAMNRWISELLKDSRFNDVGWGIEKLTPRGYDTRFFEADTKPKDIIGFIESTALPGSGLAQFSRSFTPQFEGGASRQFRGEEFNPPESDANSEPATEEEMTFTQAEKVMGAKARLNHIKSGSPLPFTTWVKTAAAEKLKNKKTKSKKKSKNEIKGLADAVQRDLDLIDREGIALSEEGSAATPAGYKGFLGNFKRGLSMLTLGQFTPTDSAKVAGAAYANQVAIDRTKMTATFLHMYHGIADMVRHGDKDRGIEKRHIRGAGWKKRQNVNWRGADTQVGDEVRAAQDFTANRGQLLGVLIQLLASAQTTGKRVDALLTKGGFMLLDGKDSKRFVVDNSDHRDALIEQISAMDPNLRLEAERLNKIMNELSDLVQPVFKKMFPNAKWNRRDFYLHIMRNYHEETIKDKQLRQNKEYKRMTPSQKERLGRMALLFEIDPNNVKNLRTLTGSGDSPILIVDANDTINHTIQDLSKFVAAGEYVRQKRALYATTEFKNKIRAALSGDADKMNLVVDSFEREIESLGGTKQIMDPTASAVGRFINRLLSNAAVSFIADPFVAVKQFGSYGNLATHFGASVWRQASLSRMDAREFKKVLNKTTVIKMRGKDVGGGYSSIWEDQRSGSGFRLTGFRGATDVIEQAREGGMFMTRKMDRFTTQRAIHMAQILVDKTWDGPKDDSYYQEIANQADLGVVTTQIQTTDFNRSMLQRNRNPFARSFTFLRGARSVSGSALLSSATLVFQSFSRLSDAQKSGDAQRIRQATAERSEALLNMKAQYIFHGMVQSVIIQTVQSGKWFLIPAVLGALGFGADDDDEEEETGMKKTMDFFVGAGGNMASLPMGGDIVFHAMKAFGDSKRGVEYSKQRVATSVAPIIGFPYDIMDFGAASAKVRKFEREIEQRQTEDGRSLTSSELRQRERWLRLNYVKQAEKGFRVISQWMLGVPFSNTISQVASKGARNLIEENYK